MTYTTSINNIKSLFILALPKVLGIRLIIAAVDQLRSIPRQEFLCLHELIKSTSLNSAPWHESSSVQDESTLPILASSHERPPVHDGPTTYGIVAYKQTSLPLHE